MHELETKRNVTNMRKVDRLLKQMKGLSNATMWGANNTLVYGQRVSVGDKIFEQVTSESPVANFIRSNMDNDSDKK